ncbi:mannose-ethanolamine phosphotransferase gpi13 [Arachnomyces sp. PD_36]|nr:mannose-ethanolamine phosphotransferase gpi13 [Arachnomyces sp. PD_36]
MPPPTPASGKPPKSEFQDIKAQWGRALAEKERAEAEARQRGENAGAGSASGAGAGAGAGLASKMRAAQSQQERMVEEAKRRDERRNKRKEGRFRAAHGWCLGLMGWVVFVHLVGIYFFTKGFLLTRLMLEDKSDCQILPFDGSERDAGASAEEGCWHPKTFDKAVVIVIDALRYDFTVPFRPTAEGETAHLFHDNFPVLYETAVQNPENAFLLPFIADPPTTTLQRLKGLMTGTLPTFIDAGSNFAGTAIDEDNLIAQLRHEGKNIVHLGDDTWHALFPGYFDEDLTRAYDSFNVWDLHTLDNGVTEHLFPLLHPDNATKWDVIFGHYLGVDHAGHRYGPDHAAMATKLAQMDRLIRDMIDSIDDETLLVVLGDHGMDAKGDHGGESDDEVEAALWMYSKKGVFGHRADTGSMEPPRTAKERPVPQIDLVPTLSLLLGMPIPFNNLGSPIEEAFANGDRDGVDFRNLATVNRLASAQIKRYQHGYASARGIDESQTSGPLSLWSEAEKLWDGGSRSDSPSLKGIYDAYREYQRDTLSVCRGLWARFDVPSMIQGIVILFAGIVLLAFYARAIRGNRTSITIFTLKRIGVGSALGIFAGAVSGFTQIVEMPVLDSSLLGTCAGGILGASSTVLLDPKRISSPLPTSLWGWLAVLFTISQSVGFASNSYTIWEDEILLFFLTTFGVLAGISSMRQKATADRVLGLYHSIVFVVLGRLASLSRLCREEQMPFCRSTYYASSTSSTSAPWQLLIPFVLAVMLPSVIRSYYRGTKSYEGSATFWIGFAFRAGLLLVAIFWILDAADDGEWFPSLKDKTTLKSIRIVLAQLVLGIAFAAGSTTFAWAKPCVSISMSPNPETEESPSSPPQPGVPGSKTSVTILGYANVHGTRYFFLLTNFILAIALVQKPMGAGSIGLLVWQILSLLEILDTNLLTTSNSSIGPIVLGLLGSFHYFKTGHQATLSSIQWESAFIPLETIRYPWSPLLVIMNTFGAQILTAIAVPLAVLWKRPIDTGRGASSSSSPTTPNNNNKPSKSNPISRLLSDVAQAVSTHILYYAVINLATTMWAGHLRRHLMLYRIFNPRFLLGAAVMVTVDVVSLAVALGGVRWSTISVADVFGWG